MINFFKRKYKEYYSIKIGKMIIDIHDEMFNDYKIAKKKFDNLIDLLDKKFNFLRSMDIYMLDVEINFGLNKHKEVLEKTQIAINSIDENTNTINEIKDHYKAFIYNMEMVSSLIEGEINRANIARKNLIEHATYEVFKTAPLHLEEMENIEERYPIINNKKQNYTLFVIKNEYSQNITESQRKLVFKYVDEVKDIIMQNKWSKR